MQSYINQLLEDIADAQRIDEPYSITEKEKSQSIEEHFIEIERWLEGEEPDHTFSYYCGLQKEQFPPAEKLTELQLKQINNAFRHLLFSWNLDANIPKEVPSAKTYSMLISLLDNKTDIVNSGFMTFEFCQYDPASCPFEQYCSCKEFENDSENDMDNFNLKNEDFPF
jgi:hypothetical protein